MAKQELGGKSQQAKSSVKTVDVSSIDGIVKALYESISFSSGNQPDFVRFRSLFQPQALIVPPKSGQSDASNPVDVELYIKNSVETIVLNGMERKGYVAAEIARRTQSFGGIVQVFSTFESKNIAVDRIPLHRGIYSIQLIRDDHRWWIVSLIWELERSDLLIPKAYLI